MSHAIIVDLCGGGVFAPDFEFSVAVGETDAKTPLFSRYSASFFSFFIVETAQNFFPLFLGRGAKGTFTFWSVEPTLYSSGEKNLGEGWVGCMVFFRLIRCSIKIQLCIGRFPDGRMRTRTFGIGGVRPDLSADDIAAVAGAIAPLLAHPVVRVRLVRKYALDARKAPSGLSGWRTAPATAETKPDPSRDLFSGGRSNRVGTCAIMASGKRYEETEGGLCSKWKTQCFT